MSSPAPRMPIITRARGMVEGNPDSGTGEGVGAGVTGAEVSVKYVVLTPVMAGWLMLWILTLKSLPVPNPADLRHV